jgi:hypothetical protein
MTSSTDESRAANDLTIDGLLALGIPLCRRHP